MGTHAYFCYPIELAEADKERIRAAAKSSLSFIEQNPSKTLEDKYGAKWVEKFRDAADIMREAIESDDLAFMSRSILIKIKQDDPLIHLAWQDGEPWIHIPYFFARFPPSVIDTVYSTAEDAISGMSESLGYALKDKTKADLTNFFVLHPAGSVQFY